MDFELGRVPAGSVPGSLIPANTALPFWTVYLGTNQQTTVLYDRLYLGTAVVTLQDTFSPVSPVLEGSYTPVLEAGTGGNLGAISASIAQTGVVPPGTRSIFFLANAPLGAGWTVTIGNQAIPVVETSQVNNTFFMYGGDISRFAGLSEELRFTALSGPGSPIDMFLDAIQFSPVAIPEPTTEALLALGGLLVSLQILRRVRGR